jgi:hypothetical protein
MGTPRAGLSALVSEEAEKSSSGTYDLSIKSYVHPRAVAVRQVYRAARRAGPVGRDIFPSPDRVILVVDTIPRSVTPELLLLQLP